MKSFRVWLARMLITLATKIHPAVKRDDMVNDQLRAEVEQLRAGMLMDYVLCYAGVPEAWRVKPEDLPWRNK
jgi:hypothetical protein